MLLSMANVLSPEAIAALLDKESTGSKQYPVPVQEGPLRHFEREMRCACKGCGSSTFFKVCGIPRCMMHALRELNLMLHDMGVES
jgi:hypothetical protein